MSPRLRPPLHAAVPTRLERAPDDARSVPVAPIRRELSGAGCAPRPGCELPRALFPRRSPGHSPTEHAGDAACLAAWYEPRAAGWADGRPAGADCSGCRSVRATERDGASPRSGKLERALETLIRDNGCNRSRRSLPTSMPFLRTSSKTRPTGEPGAVVGARAASHLTLCFVTT